MLATGMLVALTALAAPAPPRLPPPALTVPSAAYTIAGSGARLAIAAGCDLRVATFAAAGRPVVLRVPRFGSCRDDPGDAYVGDVELAGSALAATIILSPSPHGDEYTLFGGGPSGAPLHQLGGSWGWTDSDVPNGYGCAWATATSGTVLVVASGPNRLAVDAGLADDPACPAGPATHVQLRGAAGAGFDVPGSWRVLATDGARVALEQLDAGALPTGTVATYTLDGRRVSGESLSPFVLGKAYRTWLTAKGLIVMTSTQIRGRGFAIPGLGVASDAALANGDLVYTDHRTLRVRRLADGRDRALAALPTVNAEVAAGSFGVAVAISGESRTAIYRLPWASVARALSAAG